MLHKMSPSVVAITILALTNGVVSLQSTPKSTNVNTLDNECSLTKTVFELSADLKISIFKLESWKSEIDRHLVVGKEEGKLMKSTVDKLEETIEKQSKQMKDAGEEVESKIKKQTEDLHASDNIVRSEINELKADMESKLNGMKVDIESKLGGLKVEMETKFDGLKVDMESKLDGLKVDMDAKLNALSLSLETVNTKFSLLEGKVDGMGGDIKNNAEETVSLVNERIRQVATESQLNLTAHLRNHSTGGAVYNRWGATTCQQGSRLVYSGVLGGGHYSHTGTAVDSLCLPDNPDLMQQTGGEWTYIYGAEYQMGNQKNFNIPCAVCDTGRRTKVYMVPAKSVCPAGWTREYSGMLATGHFTHKAQNDFICLDQSMETIAGSNADRNGKLFYNVAATCGESMKCSNYVRGQLLTCAVCSG